MSVGVLSGAAAAGLYSAGPGSPDWTALRRPLCSRDVRERKIPTAARSPLTGRPLAHRQLAHARSQECKRSRCLARVTGLAASGRSAPARQQCQSGAARASQYSPPFPGPATSPRPSVPLRAPPFPYFDKKKAASTRTVPFSALLLLECEAIPFSRSAALAAVRCGALPCAAS